jgi:hypothetical protein
MTFQLPNVPFSELDGYSDIRDYRSTNKKQYDYVLGYLENNGFTYFNYLINQSTISKKYNDPDFKYTLCIPQDANLTDIEKKIITNADPYVANSILNYSTLPACLNKRDITKYIGFGLPTNVRNMSILIKCDGEHIYFGDSIVLGIQEQFLNKNILIVDRLLIPPHIL